MKLLIASDLHGSAACCRALLTAFEREQADRIVLLGDLLYHGPRNPFPEEYDTFAVTALLNSVKDKLLCVRGNCDSEVDQMVLQFPILSDSCLLYLDGRTVFATHGHHFNPQTPPMLKKGDILLNGHTHVPKCEPAGDFIYMNPGSVSIPKEGSTHQYILWDDGTVIFKALDGTVLRTVTPTELDAMIG